VARLNTEYKVLKILKSEYPLYKYPLKHFISTFMKIAQKTEVCRRFTACLHTFVPNHSPFFGMYMYIYTHIYCKKKHILCVFMLQQFVLERM
jgi:hypothetical protein